MTEEKEREINQIPFLPTFQSYACMTHHCPVNSLSPIITKQTRSPFTLILTLSSHPSHSLSLPMAAMPLFTRW